MNSLSSRCLTKIAESKWFYPTQYKEREVYDPENPLEGLQKTGTVSHKFDQIRAFTARAVATVAIYSFISPISCIYHTSQVLAIKKIENISDPEKLLLRKHETCAKLELIRLATVVSFASAFVFLNGVTLGIGAISAFLLTLDIGIAGPFYGSRIGDAGEGDEQWRAAIGLRLELGITQADDPEVTLNTLIAHSANRTQAAITELLKILPEEHRFPLDHINGCSVLHPQINLDLILRHCSAALESNPFIKDQIITQTGILIQYNSLTNRLLYYLDIEKRKFPLDLKKIEQPLREIECRLPLFKKIPHIQYQRPLTVTWLIKTLSSDWLYPSNCAPIVVRERSSIATTMNGIDPFMSRKTIQNRTHRPLKALRWIARAFTQTMIILIGAPAGGALNAFRAFKHYTTSHFQNDFEAFQSVEKAKSFLQAAREDIELLNFYNLQGPWKRMVYNHHESIKTVQNRQDRALITLAALLKNKYGISGNGGKLLTHDLKKDISLDHGTHPYLQSLIDKFKNEFDDALPVVIMNFDYLSVMRFEGCLKEYYHTNNPTKLAQFLYSNIKDTNRNAVFSMINALYKLAELRNLILQYHTEENSKDDFNHLSFFNSAKTQKAIANQETKQFPEFVALESELAILHVKINEHLTLFTALPDQKERITFHYLYFSAYRTGQTDLLKSFLVKKLSKEAEIDKFIRHLVRYIEINKKMKEIVDASSDASLKEGFSEFPKLVQQLNAFKLTNALEWLERLPEHQKVIKESDSVIAQKQKSTPRNDLRLANAANTLKLSRFIGAPYDHRPYSVHNPLSWRQTWTRWRLPKEFIQLRSLALTKDLTPHILFGFAQDVPLNKESIEKTYLQLKNTIELQKNSAIEEIRVQADTLLKLVESANDLLNEEMEALLSLAN